MAFDQVSLFLFPPGWRPRSAEHRHVRYILGGYVRVVRAERRPQGGGLDVPLSELGCWFENRGFAATVRQPDYAVYGSGPVASPFGPRQEIEIAVSAADGEVSALYCRFALTPDSPTRLEKWHALVGELCQSFGLCIGLIDGESVGAEDFLAVIRQSDSWKHFAAEFGWREPSAS